ncbi:DUF559 domain-containing protein [Frankia sp. AiPs1]|uniref:type IV toxin-antitoxin system AbiEi family antitoxin domain-containing protein n=1 Tax=Frankia sp. AiPa1 TaxID=573492 RepID=UPI00202B5A3F|nr:type IV toxin-antitoxin system AbiEi family antitoxin domain-containing protein [Frankia sp. AiPa1]MCL9760635.1 hypothetical protein [Frankia sp. AiPa1]
MTFSTSASTQPTRPAHAAYPGLDPALALARAQGGMITFRQAIDSGLTRGQLRRLVLSGQWNHPVRGAFVVPSAARRPASPSGGVGVPTPKRPDLVVVSDRPGVPVDSGNPVGSGGPAALGGRGAPGDHGVEAGAVGLPPATGTLAARVRAALVGRPQAVACGVTAARLLGFAAPGLPAAGYPTFGSMSPTFGSMSPGSLGPQAFLPGTFLPGLSVLETAGTGAVESALSVPGSVGGADDGSEPVHLILPARLTRAQPRGIRLHFTDLAATERIEHDGIPLTSPERTLADLVLAAPGREAAVAVMDAALHAAMVPDLRAVRHSVTGRRGYRRVQAWWSLADRRAQSPLETRLRLLFADAGLAPPRPQWAVSDAAGQVIAQLDLAWPALRVAVEADLAPASRPAAMMHRERQRANLLAAMHWTVLRFSDLDVAWFPERVAETVARCLSGAPSLGRQAS